jgi:ABC-type polysaccharide/polyol phosphate export permease
MWSSLVRQTHRWVSLVFMAIVAAIFIALGTGREPASWVYFLPLLPLALLMLTGLHMFCLPYVARWRSGRRAGGAIAAGRHQTGRPG